MTWNYSQKTTELFMAAVQGKPGTHLGEIEDADGFGEHGSIACGDALRFTFRVDRHPDDPLKDRITEARYLTFGCTSAIAASEALCAIIEEGDYTPIEALKITNQDIVDERGLMDLILQIVDLEGPIEKALLLTRVLTTMGWRRSAGREEMFESALRMLASEKAVHIYDETVSRAEINLIWPVRVPRTVLQPTPQWSHMLGTLVNSQARAPKRKSRVVRAPTGQISVVLPE